MGMEHDDLITLKNVSVSYWQNNVGVHSLKDLFVQRKNPFQSKTILHDINLTVKKGQSLGMLGRNGCGKSTLLRTIAGIIKPQTGTLTVNGTFAPILALGAGVELELSGYENINLMLSLYGIPKKNTDALANIKDFSELTDEVLRMPVKRYSSGMAARLAFSISLANEADILIVDEVLAVGDQGFQAKCMDKIFQIKNEGKSILFVSHFPDSVREICDTAILIENGVIVENGNVDYVCMKYNELF